MTKNFELLAAEIEKINKEFIRTPRAVDGEHDSTLTIFGVYQQEINSTAFGCNVIGDEAHLMATLLMAMRAEKRIEKLVMNAADFFTNNREDVEKTYEHYIKKDITHNRGTNRHFKTDL